MFHQPEDKVRIRDSIKALLIDGNLTLENPYAILNNYDQLIAYMAKKISLNWRKCSESDIRKKAKEFNSSFGKQIWEYYPVFWRAVLQNNVGDKIQQKDIEAVYNMFLNYYAKNTSLYPETKEFLEIQYKKRKLAFVANGHDLRLRRFIDNFQLDKYFSCYAISEESPFRKPHNFQYLYALRELKVSPANCLMIGDRFDTDMMGARLLGIRGIHIQRDGSNLFQLGKPWYCPNALVNNLSEITNIIDNFPIFPWPSDSNILANMNYNPEEAIILCGGRGSRMRPVTDNIQKCVINIGGIPVLSHLMRCLSAVGCKKIFAVLEYRPDDVQNILDDYKNSGFEITYIKKNFKTSLEMVLHTVQYIKGDSFYYVHGDIIFPPRLLEALWHNFVITQSSSVAIVPSEKPINHARVQIDKQGWITNAKASGNADVADGFLCMGVALYKKKAFSFFPPNAGPGYYADEAINLGNMNGLKTAGVLFQGKWVHLENMDDLINAQDKTPMEQVSW